MDQGQDAMVQSEPRITNYRDFWPFYLGEHAQPGTRAIHFAGTIVSTLLFLAAIVRGDAWFALAALFAGYGPAWVAHFFVEKNRPATFRYPLWSLVSDYRMTWTWLTGRLENELKRAKVQARPRRRDDSAVTPD